VLANALAAPPPELPEPPAALVGLLPPLPLPLPLPEPVVPEPDPDELQAAAPRPAATTVPVTATSRINCRRLSWLSMVYRNSFG